MTVAATVEALLRGYGARPDSPIDLAEAALSLASLDRPGVSLARYRDHFRLLAADVAGYGAGSLDERVAALRTVMFESYGYTGDRRTYDDLQNANLIRVIDRRRGLPVALGILMIHAARAQGWDLVGLRFPGHFLLRMEHRGQRAILDPFEGGARLTAADLRALLRAQGDEAAELEPAHYQTASDREVLLRLQNNIKMRQSQRGNNSDAAETLERMLWLAPEDKGLWREKAVLATQLGRIEGAVEALEQYIARETLDGPRHDAALLLQKLRGHNG